MKQGKTYTWIIVLTILSAGGQRAYAQDNDPATTEKEKTVPDKSIMRLQSFTDAVSWGDKGVWPETPRAATIREVTTPRPSLLTGAAEFSVPLHVMHAEGKEIPFEFRYHSNGNRVSDDPCPWGYGWALLPDIRISRRIIGRPDGFFRSIAECGKNTLTNNECFHAMTDSMLYMSANRQPDDYTDPAPDIYTIRLADASLTAVFRNGQAVMAERGEYRIEANDILTDIKVTDPDGFVYHFDTQGECSYTPALHTELLPSRITCPSGKEITFTYKSCQAGSHMTQHASPHMEFFVRDDYGTLSSYDAGYIHPDSRNVMHLASMEYNGEKVTLEYGTGGRTHVTRMTVAEDGKEVRAVTFTYDSAGTVPEKVSTPEGDYSFAYNPNKLLQPVGRDWWGFSNGASHYWAPSVSLNLSAALGLTHHSSWSYNSGCDRSVNEEYMKARMLVKAVYPTGGYTTWEYEAHRFVAQTPRVNPSYYRGAPVLTRGGGLRVSRIRTYEKEGDTSPTEVSYVYGENGNGLAVCEAAPTIDTFLDTWDYIDYCTTGSRELFRSTCVVSVSTESNYMRYRPGQVPIWYTKVEEITHEGKTAFTFDDIIDDSGSYAPCSNLGEWPGVLAYAFSDGPQMTSRTVYASEGNTYRKVSETAISYFATLSDVVNGYHIRRHRRCSEQTSNYASPDFSGCDRLVFGDPVYIESEPYNSPHIPGTPSSTLEISEDFAYTNRPFSIRVRRELPYSETTTEYLENGNRTVKTDYTYVSGTGLISEVKVTSGDNTLVNTTTYPTSQSPDAIVREMAGRNMSGTAIGHAETYGGCTTTKEAYMEKAGKTFRPASVYTTMSGREFSEYSYTWNSDGNMTASTDVAGVKTTYTWDARGRHPVGMSQGNMSWSATWQPGCGPSSVTSPDGVKETYTYDSAGRLKDTAISGLGTMTSRDYRISQTGGSYVRETTRLSASGTDNPYVQSNHDGLGRVSSSVTRIPGATYSAGSFVATAISYDRMGRPCMAYSPAPVTDSAPSVGSVASAAATYHSDQKPYSLTAYEPSQRRQAVSSTKAGEAWHNGGHRTTVRRLVNDQSAYRCPKLTVDSDGGITMSGYYTTGTLSVEETTDEEGLAEAVFTDIRGLCLLRRRGNAETHYIYDGYGLLRYILPPDVTPATMTAGNSVLTESAYVYSYDYRGKVEYAKIPGRGPSRYRYDSAGRLLAETDADLGGKWRIHVYDTAGRDVMQAECAITEEGILNIKEAQNAQPPQKGTGTWGYTTPYSLPSGFSVCRADYYDGYGGFDAAQPMTGYGGATLVATPKGRLTGTRLRCDDGTDHTLTYRYDRFGRLAQTTDVSGSHTHTTATEYNYSGQPVKVTEKLRHMSGESWNERMFVTEHTYDKAGRLSSTTVKLDGKTVAYTERGYDGIGRPASVAMKKSDGATVWSGQEYLYDVHGWPTRLKTSLWSGGAAVASVSGLASAYYPEASLTGGVTEAATQVESYTETVSYADGSSPRYDGTPSSRTLVNGGRYDYTFDSLCRLTGADYTPPQGNGGEDFSAEYTYDILSRPLTAKRMGVVDTDGTTETFGVLDDMSLEYDGALPSVRRSDTGEVEGRSFYGRTGWTQGISMASSTMDFNSAGRLVKDTGRGLGTVQYNTLGLPTLMSSATTNHSASPHKKRVYDAAGRLMGQTEAIKLPYGYGYGLGVTDDRRFIGSFTLNHEAIERVDFPGGYVDGTGNAHFLYRDWQGNVVLTVDGDNNVEQMVGYYPYGEPWREPWGQRQTLFAGKERQHGQLSGDWDFGPRHLSSPSMLWSAPDVNAADNPWWSPWAYCGGNPVRYVDPNGQDVLITVGDRIITITAELILYGDGATEEIRDIYQKKINEVWGQVTKYRHNAHLGGLATEYDVEWDVNVRLKGLEENIVYNGYNNDVEVIMNPNDFKKKNRSSLSYGHSLELRGYGRNGRTLRGDNPIAHEFGHIIGLGDKYDKDTSDPIPGYETDVMAARAYKTGITISCEYLTELFSEAVRHFESLTHMNNKYFKLQANTPFRFTYYRKGFKSKF